MIADVDWNGIKLREVVFALMEDLPAEFDAIISHTTMVGLGITLCDSTAAICTPIEFSAHATELPITLGNDLTASEKAELHALVLEFEDCFGTTFSFNAIDSPPTSHRIELVDASKQPPRARVRPLSPPKQTILKQQLDDLLARGLVRPSKSPYAAPVVLAEKHDGTTRFCVDYRMLNANTKRDNYPLPRIPQLLERLAGNRYYSAMDLLSGFWQIPMHPDDVEKTAFITPFGLFEFLVMPFGLRNATATFQRLTDSVFGDCRVQPYVDDLVTGSQEFTSHMSDLRKIFSQMRKYRLKAKPSKCRFGLSTIDCLGHELSLEGIRPRKCSMEAVLRLSAPSTVSELRSFLGMTGYYQKHIANYAVITSPLRDLLSKDASFHWDRQCEEAFQQLKLALSTRPIISPPNYDYPFVLTTDACCRGLGAVLHQTIDGNERVIAYASQSLKPAERNYSTTEQEALAIVWAFDKFREYLDGVPFHIETDHRALQFIFDQKKPANSRIARWQAALQGQHFTIKHRSGTSIPQADALSRLPSLDQESNCDSWIEETPFCLLALSDVKEAQLRDPDCIQLLADKDHWPNSGYELVDDIIVRKETNASRVVIPASMRHKILQQAHENSGHLGVNKFLPLLRNHCYWPNMKTDAQLVCSSCIQCAKFNLPRRSFHNGLHSITATEPFQIVGADIVGPLPTTDEGYQYFIIFVDYFSNYVAAECVDSIDAKTLAQTFRSCWLDRFHSPIMFICDGGSQFLSQEFKRFLARKKIQLEASTFYHQQANGKAERTIQTIKKMVAKKLKEGEFQTDWDVALPEALNQYNNAIQVETKFSPAQLALNEEPPAITDISVTSSQPLPLEDKIEQAKLNIAKAQERQRRNFDRKHKTWKIVEGDSVMVRKKLFDGENKSLAEQYYGPYEVQQVLEYDTFVLKDFPSAVSIDRLKPYTPEEEAKRHLLASRPIPMRALGSQAQAQTRNVIEYDSDDESNYVIDDIIMIKPVIGIDASD